MTNFTILRKFLLSALLLIVVALGSAAIFLTPYTAASERRHAEETMAAQTRILLPALAAVDTQSLEAWSARAAIETRARVTIIARDGAVLVDSQHDPSTMENHAGRPEVRQALAGATGTAVRHSATLDADLCYLAVPADLQGQPGVILRLAVPLRQIDVAAAAVRWLIVRASLVAALFALAVAFFFSRTFTRRIRRIQRYAQDLVNAEYSGTLASQPDDELGSVARSLRGMAEQFRRMLGTLEEELARRKALLAGMVEGVLAVDHELRVTFCNSSFAPGGEGSSTAAGENSGGAIGTRSGVFGTVAPGSLTRATDAAAVDAVGRRGPRLRRAGCARGRTSGRRRHRRAARYHGT